jgi:hypothetical protein
MVGGGGSVGVAFGISKNERKDFRVFLKTDLFDEISLNEVINLQKTE